MMCRKGTCLVVALLFVGGSPSIAGKMNKCVAPDGSVTFTTQACPAEDSRQRIYVEAPQRGSGGGLRQSEVDALQRSRAEELRRRQPSTAQQTRESPPPYQGSFDQPAGEIDSGTQKDLDKLHGKSRTRLTESQKQRLRKDLIEKGVDPESVYGSKNASSTAPRSVPPPVDNRATYQGRPKIKDTGFGNYKDQYGNQYRHNPLTGKLKDKATGKSPRELDDRSLYK